MGFKLGVDVGGTFTDLSLFDEESGNTIVLKLPSTVEDPSLAIVNGIKSLLSTNNIQASEITYLVHGTTVGTNTAIERKGAKTALITTKGFGDLLEIGRQTRPSIYDLFQDKPDPLVRRELRKEVTERIKYDGTTDRELDREEIVDVINLLKNKKVESVSVCFLHSYINSTHEQEVKQLLFEYFPEAYVSVSSDVLPQYREFERFSTTTLNSYLGPKVSGYVSNFEQRVKDLGVKVAPYINQSNSGVMSIETTKKNPARTALSGPSAGVSGANYVSELAGFKNIITFDMGGTSTDVCLIEDSKPKVTIGKKVAGFPLNLPMTDVHAVGAGGGSIAWVDAGGILKVGPESAGSTPGPAAYDRGGLKPTVTDANVVLQRLNPEYILGGKMRINQRAAREVIEKEIARPLNMSLMEAAKGIITIVNSNMVRAIRVVSVERGFDPRDFTLVAFGGAGALHAAFVAQELGIKHVLIPENPGILCALGLLVSDLKMDFVKTRLLDAHVNHLQEINNEIEKLTLEGLQWLDKEKVKKSQQKIERKIDMRYHGQNYELSIPLDRKLETKEDLDRLLEKFHQEHEKNYGYAIKDEQVELINYRVTALGEIKKICLKEHEVGNEDPSGAKIAERDVYFNKKDGFVKTSIYDRSLLRPNHVIKGPAIVEQMDSTIVIPPQATAKIDRYQNIIMTYRGE